MCGNGERARHRGVTNSDRLETVHGASAKSEAGRRSCLRAGGVQSLHPGHHVTVGHPVGASFRSTRQLEGRTMQVVMCEAYGGPESLVVKSVASPSPGSRRGQDTPACAWRELHRRAADRRAVPRQDRAAVHPRRRGRGRDLAAGCRRQRIEGRRSRPVRRRLRRGNGAGGRQRHQAARYGRLRGGRRLSLQLHDRLLRPAASTAAAGRDAAGARCGRRRRARHRRHGQADGRPRHRHGAQPRTPRGVQAAGCGPRDRLQQGLPGRGVGADR